jgi:hypothetical protein
MYYSCGSCFDKYDRFNLIKSLKQRELNRKRGTIKLGVLGIIEEEYGRRKEVFGQEPKDSQSRDLQVL